MMRVKQLDRLVLRSFIPLLAMTFFIVLFVVLMQFLWKYIDDLVGKGLTGGVLGELFFYAALSMVPMSIPLAVLLASLMTFGNLGERTELTAMKGAGIPLIRVMLAPAILCLAIGAGAFVFQDTILPKAQVKMWTLLFSMRQKSPELEIPEGAFYSQVPGYNLFVEHKDRDTGMLYGMMIYSTRGGSGGSTILLSDSARMSMTRDMKYLYLQMWSGEEFENLREAKAGDTGVPFRRESFVTKNILIPFDANFNRLDDEGMRRQYVGKDIAELHHAIDSLTVRLDSIGTEGARQLVEASKGADGYMDQFTFAQTASPSRFKAVPLTEMLAELADGERMKVFEDARSMMRRERENMQFQWASVSDEKRLLRRHEIELVKKYTLSVACLIFFFIGAPLGSVIRKGGIGTPLVTAIFLFLVYYIIDNTGYKMARDGRWPVWLGMWLSTFILAPLGVAVTWAETQDRLRKCSEWPGAVKEWVRRALGLHQDRRLEQLEVVIDEFDPSGAYALAHTARLRARRVLRRIRRDRSYCRYLRRARSLADVAVLADELDVLCDDLRLSRDKRLLYSASRLPVVRRLWIYAPAGEHRLLGLFYAWCPVVGLPLWLLSRRPLKVLARQLESIGRLCTEICDVLGEEMHIEIRAEIRDEIQNETSDETREEPEAATGDAPSLEEGPLGESIEEITGDEGTVEED